MIDFNSESISFTLSSEEQVGKWIEKVVVEESKELGALSVIFCSDDYLLEINKKHLDHDYYTDIITFDYTEGSLVSGDLFISIDRTTENAKKLTVNELDELDRVIVHGTLHLLGYKDKTPTDKALMTEKEDYYLSLRPFTNA